MPVSDDIREQRQSIKDKGFKYKFSYYWEYYRKPALIIAAIAIMVISIIKTIVTATDSAYSVIFINSLNGPEATEFEEVLGIDTKKYDVSFDPQFVLDIEGGGMDETTYVNSQKLVAMVSAKALDAVTGDDYSMKYYAGLDMLGDVRDFFTEAELEEMGDRIVWVDVTYTDDDGNDAIKNVPVLIDITDSKKLAECNAYFTEPVYLGIIVNTTHPETASVFYDYLMK